jgi:hypothetical protein
MQLQLNFELILTYTKAAMDNWRNFYFHIPGFFVKFFFQPIYTYYAN